MTNPLLRNVRIESILAELPCPQLVLELGCGSDDAAAQYFSRACPRTRWIGIDRDVTRLASLPHWVVQADIRRLPLWAQADLVVIRHPDIDRRPVDWQAALAVVPHLLVKGGLLLITTYSLHEYETIGKWVGKLPFQPRKLEEMSLAAADLVGRDRFFHYLALPANPTNI